MSLYAIENDEIPQPVRVEPLPSFEGNPVHEVAVKLAAVSDLDLGQERAYKLDEVVHVVATIRVSRVDHIVDEKSGNLVRQHVMKVVDAVPVTWDQISDTVLGKL